MELGSQPLGLKKNIKTRQNVAQACSGVAWALQNAADVCAGVTWALENTVEVCAEPLGRSKTLQMRAWGATCTLENAAQRARKPLGCLKTRPRCAQECSRATFVLENNAQVCSVAASVLELDEPRENSRELANTRADSREVKVT